jgi:hypothetical protein
MNRIATIMAAAIVLLMAGIILLLAWQLRSEINTDRRLLQEIRDMRAKLADKSRRDAFELQKECGSQASKVFAQLGWKLDEPQNGVIAAFESHYNVVMNKCFMLLHTLSTTTQLSLASSMLHDAYEQREYAKLNLTTNRDGVKHIATCALFPLQGDQSTCQSEAEYESFVAHYMEATPVGTLGNP